MSTSYKTPMQNVSAITVLRSCAQKNTRGANFFFFFCFFVLFFFFVVVVVVVKVKIFDIILFFCSNHKLWVYVRTASVWRF